MLRREPLDQMRFQREVTHLHSLGGRVLAEFLDELANRIGGAQACRGMLADYRRLSPRVACVIGADRFPTAIRSVRQ